MPAFRSGEVVGILAERDGLQKVEVDLGHGPERAYVLTQLIGPVAAGDRVVVNTTAVELGLGTGGWHFVHWNLDRDEWRETGPGHIMKLRYTSLQADVGSTEEHLPAEIASRTSVDGMPVVASPLHSQLPAVAIAIKTLRPDAHVAYVRTDGAALPLALSDLVAELGEKGLVDTTITAGHAFGGDHEAVTVASALLIARHVAHADVAIVAMGPGIVGTNSTLGFTGLEVGNVLDTAVGVGGVPIVALRASHADPRERHRGLSHHILTTLTVGTRSRVVVPVPDTGEDAADLLADLGTTGIAERHTVVTVATPDVLAGFATNALHVTSMGRPAAEDPILFRCAAAAGAASVLGITPDVA
ncbi:MAG: DUF3866 family protein [Acidimicrobiia bacterium]